VSTIRRVGSGVLTVLACLLVWLCLVFPNELRSLSPWALVLIPLEALLFVGVILTLPPRAGRFVAVGVGIVLGILMILKVLDAGFYAALGRPFNPELDWSYAGSAIDLLGNAIGKSNARLVAGAAAVLAVALLVLVPLAVLRLARIIDRHRTGSLRGAVVLGVAWVVLALFGVQSAAGEPIASASTGALAVSAVDRVYEGFAEQRAFAEAAAVDAYRDTPGDQLLTALRGKDVLLVFVESYGRVALENPVISPSINALLDDGTSRLQDAGFSAKSGFLTSSTYGGISWLAHSTLQTGLWVNNQRRYDDIVASDRFNLSSAFKRAGWRTISDIPSDNRAWPEGTSFYHYDRLYDSRNVGYRGRSFSYAPIPDQYTLSALRRLELDNPNRPPIMAEIDFVSSHTPWTPLPSMVDWAALGNGRIYNGMPQRGQPPSVVWRDANQVRAMYGKSIEYSLSSLISYVETFHDDNLVLVVLGDHQPATIVSGQDASHDVPISIIAKDPAVLDRITSWGWQDGLRPAPDAPVWRMDTFRDRFLAAYGPAGR
jgi:hypothetical protein